MTGRPLESLSTPFFPFLCSFTCFHPILLYFSCNLRTARWLQPSSDKTVTYPSAILFFSDTDNCCRIFASTQHEYYTHGNFFHFQFLKHRNRGNNEWTQNDHSGGLILHQNSHSYLCLKHCISSWYYAHRAIHFRLWNTLLTQVYVAMKST